MKKLSAGFIGYIALIVITVISAIVYILNSIRPYYHDFSFGILILFILAILLAAAITFYQPKEDNNVFKIIFDVARPVIAILIVVALVNFVGRRVESFGYIFGSNLELGNEEAFAAGSQAIRLIIILAITWIASIVAAFLPLKKKVVEE